MSIAKVNEYATAEHALKYLAGGPDSASHRKRGCVAGVDSKKRWANSRSGYWRMAACSRLRIDRPATEGVALDFCGENCKAVAFQTRSFEQIGRASCRERV